jgi:hypothetical protein
VSLTTACKDMVGFLNELLHDLSAHIVNETSSSLPEMYGGNENGFRLW